MAFNEYRSAALAASPSSCQTLFHITRQQAKPNKSTFPPNIHPNNPMGVDHLPPGQHRTHGDHPPMNVALATPLFVLGGTFAILFVGRLAVTLHRRRRLRAILRDGDQSRFAQRNGFMAWFNKHVVYAPLLSTRHSREFDLGGVHMGSLPLRIETILLAGYLGINLAFFVCLIDWWEDYEELMYQLKYAAGHLAVMNTPALVLTAGRNNPLIPLLGIQFDAFNLLHRWVGRLAVVGAVVHVACVVAAKAAESKFSPNSQSWLDTDLNSGRGKDNQADIPCSIFYLRTCCMFSFSLSSFF